MNLFEYRNWKLEAKPEAFTIKAFKVLMDRDKSKDKKVGLKELAYVYHMSDNMSPFASYLDESRRSEDVIKKVDLGNKWKPDEAIIEAIKTYKELDETITSLYLDSVKIALSKVEKYFRNFDEEQATTADITRIDAMAKGSVNTVKSVRELEKLVKQDKETESTIRGNRNRPIFHDTQ